MAILRSKEIWEMEIEDIEEKLVELKAKVLLQVLMKTLVKLENSKGLLLVFLQL